MERERGERERGERGEREDLLMATTVHKGIT
jgi:hypothetical protein